MSDQRFQRGERLKSRKEIDRLFGKEGRSMNAYPLRMVYAKAEEIRGDFAYQASFVVPKRRFKKAVDRNLLKRRVREAFRRNKQLLTRARPQVPREDDEAETQSQYALMFIYTGKEAMPYAYIERKMRKLLGQLVEWD
ncbi:MAG: ribonuclease P protein component [Bacteroidota bacterium]